MVSIKVKMDGKEIELEPEKARELYEQLKVLFGKEGDAPMPYIPYIPTPVYPSVPTYPLWPWEVTCGTDHITVSDGTIN